MLEKTSNEHSEAVRAYSSWLKSFEEWKSANKDHPDRQAFAEYANIYNLSIFIGTNLNHCSIILALLDTSVTPRLNAAD